MKIIEVTHGLTLMITNEEADLLLKFDEQTPVVLKRELDQRQQLMANSLVNKNVLLRLKENGNVIYKRKTG